MKILIKILARFLDKRKFKNPVMLAVAQSIIILVYVTIQKLVEFGIIPDNAIFSEVIEYLGIILMAILGTNTVAELPKNFTPTGLKDFFAKFYDTFKTNNPLIFAGVQVALIAAYSVLTYGGFTLGPILQVVLQLVTLLGVMITGSRTVKFIMPEEDAKHTMALRNPSLEYYD